MQGVWVPSLVRSCNMPHSQENKNIKQEQYRNKFNKNLKDGPHQKTLFKNVEEKKTFPESKKRCLQETLKGILQVERMLLLTWKYTTRW